MLSSLKVERGVGAGPVGFFWQSFSDFCASILIFIDGLRTRNFVFSLLPERRPAVLIFAFGRLAFIGSFISSRRLRLNLTSISFIVSSL